MQRTIHNKIEGEQIIHDNLILHGMIIGKTTVAKGGNLELHGMIVGDLVLLPNSKVILRGMVNGDVINKGGELNVFGMINGDLIKQSGSTNVDPIAAINGKNI